MLAIVEALQEWSEYLLNYPFRIFTDCKTFADTMNKKDAPPKIARWAIELQKYDFQVAHRSRTHNSKRKKATRYGENDLIAIKHMQFGTDLKLRGKFFGPYKIIKAKRNERFEVEKVGIHDGPYWTTSSVDFMKKWMND